MVHPLDGWKFFRLPSLDSTKLTHSSFPRARMGVNLYCYCSAIKLCPTLWNPMDCSTPGFPVLCCLLGVCSDSCPLSQWCHLICMCQAYSGIPTHCWAGETWQPEGTSPVWSGSGQQPRHGCPVGMQVPSHQTFHCFKKSQKSSAFSVK